MGQGQNDQGVLNRPKAASQPLQSERPALNVQEVLHSDAFPPPETLLTASDHIPEHRPIPASRYYARDFFDAEIDKMWSRVWQMACWAQDIPNPGDISVYRNGADSVLIVRQQDGSLKAFRNMCLHRGRELCTEHTSQRQLRCPYHAFTWDLGGDLQWLPAAWDFPQIDRASFSLPEVRLEEWNGFIFINMDAEAAPLSTYLGSMVDQWRDWDFSSRYRALTVEIEVDCNWKAVIDAFIEVLHVFAAHPEVAALTPDTATQYDIYPDEPHFNRFHFLAGFPSASIHPEPSDQQVLDCYVETYFSKLFGTPAACLLPGETPRQAMSRLARVVYQERAGMDVQTMSEAELLDGTEYFVFPNLIIWPSVANPLGYRVRPGATPDTAIWEAFFFLPFSGERPPSGPVIKVEKGGSLADVRELGYMGPVLQQDAEQFQAIQRGLRAGGKNAVLQMSRYQESRIQHYHQTIDKYLAGEI